MVKHYQEDTIKEVLEAAKKNTRTEKLLKGWERTC